MIVLRKGPAFALAGHLVLGAAAVFAQTAASAPVSGDTEPRDTRIVRLPGPRPAPVEEQRKLAPAAPDQEEPATTAVPALPATPEPSKPVPPPIESGHFRPADLDRDSGAFCQKRIGRWTEKDATEALGPPERERAALGDGGAETGRILAFSDPSGRHREIELDFDAKTGLLRTVFVYPWYMSWEDCRRRWGLNVSAAKANKGRMFYSYLDRRLDVLVDSEGKVVSFGLY
ncbi:MAG: hypothetical protein LAQ30_06615 [Acidobacteriia bacterium]|nr:hypothetical protein [Terriglobia bacterium]